MNKKTLLVIVLSICGTLFIVFIGNEIYSSFESSRNFERLRNEAIERARVEEERARREAFEKDPREWISLKYDMGYGLFSGRYITLEIFNRSNKYSFNNVHFEIEYLDHSGNVLSKQNRSYGKIIFPGGITIELDDLNTPEAMSKYRINVAGGEAISLR